MKIEAGKYYRTRDGRKVGPMVLTEKGAYSNDIIDDYACVWNFDGSAAFFGYEDESDYPSADLIAKWTDEETGTVRTVTRQEIVPGVYGKICVSTPACDGVYIGIGGVMGNSYVNNHGAKCQLMSLQDLRAAVATLTEIADAMEESQ